MKILLIGNSQVVALKQAMDRRIAAGRSPEGIDIQVKPIGSGLELHSGFFSASEGVVATHSSFYPPLAFSNDGSSHLRIGIIGPLYTLGLCGSTDWLRFRPTGVSGGKMPVSTSLIRTTALNLQQHMLGFIDALQLLGSNIFVLEAARLFRHHERLIANGLQLSSRVDQLFRNAMLLELQKRNVPTILIPPSLTDDQGFMLEEYRSEKKGDQNHANIDFGDILIDQVLAWAKSQILSGQHHGDYLDAQS